MASLLTALLALSALFACLPDGYSRSLPSLSSRQLNVARCGNICRFRLCTPDVDNIPISTVNPRADFVTLVTQGTAFVPFICTPRRPNTIGRILAVAPVRVQVNGSFTGITSFTPPDLPDSDLPYPSDAVGIAPIMNRMMTGISVGNISPAQYRELNQRCMTMGIRRFETVDFDTRERVRTIRVRPNPRNCVAFRTFAPRIIFALVWDTQDDFDLVVTEPDGDLVDRGLAGTTTTNGGRFGGDMNVNTCRVRAVMSGMEFATFSDFNDGTTVEEGEYQISAVHFNRCRNMDTNWELKVIVDGVQSILASGVATMGNGEEVAAVTFTFP
eukprot:GFKZ01003372.1.p1 GENE.GFKZ01003372.1~~GFKZ01003372.1.p1  ORF type:complete len:366 (-),score=21.14 GFKZ01003372.1:394-1377(-)